MTKAHAALRTLIISYANKFQQDAHRLYSHALSCEMSLGQPGQSSTDPHVKIPLAIVYPVSSCFIDALQADNDDVNNDDTTDETDEGEISNKLARNTYTSESAIVAVLSAALGLNQSSSSSSPSVSSPLSVFGPVELRGAVDPNIHLHQHQRFDYPLHNNTSSTFSMPPRYRRWTVSVVAESALSWLASIQPTQLLTLAAVRSLAERQSQSLAILDTYPPPKTQSLLTTTNQASSAQGDGSLTSVDDEWHQLSTYASSRKRRRSESPSSKDMYNHQQTGDEDEEDSVHGTNQGLMTESVNRSSGLGGAMMKTPSSPLLSTPLKVYPPRTPAPLSPLLSSLTKGGTTANIAAISRALNSASQSPLILSAKRAKDITGTPIRVPLHVTNPRSSPNLSSSSSSLLNLGSTFSVEPEVASLSSSSSLPTSSTSSSSTTTFATPQSSSSASKIILTSPKPPSMIMASALRVLGEEDEGTSKGMMTDLADEWIKNEMLISALSTLNP